MNHPRGHEGVGTSVDEKHGAAATAHLLQGRSLAETPAVAHAAKCRSGIHERERRQGELRAELSRELVPHACVAAILHKTPHIRRQLFARKTHRRGRPHRHSVHNDTNRVAPMGKKVTGNGRPTLHVKPVFPPHLYGFAVAEAVGVEVGQQDVEAQVAVIHPSEVEELNGAVLVAVHNHCGAPVRTVAAQVEGVSLASVGHDDYGVAQQSCGAQTVHPRLHVGHTTVQHRVGAVHVLTVGVGRERETEHVETAASDNGQYRNDNGGQCDCNLFLHTACVNVGQKQPLQSMVTGRSGFVQAGLNKKAKSVESCDPSALRLVVPADMKSACAASGTRTRTAITGQGILSPSCLPIPPLRLSTARIVAAKLPLFI